MNGAILSTGITATTWGIYWGTNDVGTTTGGWSGGFLDFGVPSLAPSTNSQQVAGLGEATVYYYRVFATNADGVAWSSPVTFSSLSTPHPPVLNNSPGGLSLSATSERLRGTLISGNPAPMTWICWGTNDCGQASTGDWQNVVLVSANVPIGVFSTDVTSLGANATYWYCCVASNIYGTVWASPSTNFTVAGPDLSISDVSLLEGAAGTFTTAVLTVSLSVTSTVAVSMNYATADGSATVANNDYVATNGTLTIPAGSSSGTIGVTVVGNDIYEPNKTFTVNLSGVQHANPVQATGTATIINDDFAIYVRGDGLGSDANTGGTWTKAYATLQTALTAVPFYTQMIIRVQASTNGQSYAPCTRSMGGGKYVLIDLEGGWQNVDGSPVQNGVSVIASPATNQDGLAFNQMYHGSRLTLNVNKFVLSNVVNGINYTESGQDDGAGCKVTLSNVVVAAQANGVCLSYPKNYSITYAGGPCWIRADNVNILAGLGGVGDGIYVNGSWMGSSVTAGGVDPATGAPRVSTIRSAGGRGLCLLAAFTGEGVHNVVLSNTVVYSCAGTGILFSAGASDPVHATLNHCTVANNGGDGLLVTNSAAGSGAYATNCIFAGNMGRGVGMGTASDPAMLVIEDYNVVSGNTLATNDVTVAALGVNTSAGDPRFYGRGAKPSPWYLLSSHASPAYHSASDGGNRGAYQQEQLITTGSSIFFR